MTSRITSDASVICYCEINLMDDLPGSGYQFRRLSITLIHNLPRYSEWSIPPTLSLSETESKRTKENHLFRLHVQCWFYCGMVLFICLFVCLFFNFSLHAQGLLIHNSWQNEQWIIFSFNSWDMCLTPIGSSMRDANKFNKIYPKSCLLCTINYLIVWLFLA